MGYRGPGLMDRYKVLTDGFGFGIWESSRYLGQWKDGKPHGTGGLFSGDCYEGHWFEGVRHGEGSSTWESVHSKEGFTNPPRFVGTWKNGMPWEGTEYDFNGSPMAIIESGRYSPVKRNDAVMYAPYRAYG